MNVSGSAFKEYFHGHCDLFPSPRELEAGAVFEHAFLKRPFYTCSKCNAIVARTFRIFFPQQQLFSDVCRIVIEYSVLWNSNTFSISHHDLETRPSQSSLWLRSGNKGMDDSVSGSMSHMSANPILSHPLWSLCSQGVSRDGQRGIRGEMEKSQTSKSPDNNCFSLFCFSVQDFLDKAKKEFEENWKENKQVSFRHGKKGGSKPGKGAFRTFLSHRISYHAMRVIPSIPVLPS